MNEVHIITWHWPDKSGFGIVRAYDNEEDAKRDLAMMKQHADSKNFDLATVELIGGAYD